MADLPVEEIAKMCDFRIGQGFTIWQKWTCMHCGSRQTMSEPDLLYRSGNCEECGKTSIISRCGFMMAKGGIVRDINAELTS